jgi:hypothetical protein
MGRLLLGAALVLACQWAGRRLWRRWRAFDNLPDEMRRRSY